MREKKPTLLLQRIFELRKAKKISLEDLGKVLGKITASGASSVENGEVPLKAEYLPAIAKLLGVQPWELLVDYDDDEVGPLSADEKTLLLRFRKVSSQEKQQTILNTLKFILEEKS